MVFSLNFIANACNTNEKSNKDDLAKEKTVLNEAPVNKVSKSSEAVKKAVMSQLNASAKRDVESMKKVLHDDFRIVVNQAERLTVLDLKTMLSLYEQGKFGGEEKEIDLQTIDIQGDLTAMVKVIEKGKKAIFNIYFTLINVKGDWKIIQETAYLDYL